MTPLKLLLNSYHSGANAWFALAEERGYFEAEGLAVEVAVGNGGFRAPILLVEGGHDVTFGDMGSLIRLAAATPGEAPVGIFAVHHRGPSAIAVPEGSPVQTPADLEGRRILGHASDVALRTFPAYAAKAAIDPGKVAVEVSDDTMAQMLVTMLDGGTDGVFGYVSSMRAVLRERDPALARQLRFLTFPDVVDELYGSMIIASRDAIATRPEALRAFLRAITRSLIEAVENPAAAIDAVLKRNTALDRDIEIARWNGTIAEEMSHPEIAGLGFGAIDAGRLAAGALLMAQTVPLPNAPSAQELFDPAFLPALADRKALADACAVDGLV